MKLLSQIINIKLEYKLLSIFALFYIAAIALLVFLFTQKEQKYINNAFISETKALTNNISSEISSDIQFKKQLFENNFSQVNSINELKDFKNKYHESIAFLIDEEIKTTSTQIDTLTGDTSKIETIKNNSVFKTSEYCKIDSAKILPLLQKSKIGLSFNILNDITLLSIKKREGSKTFGELFKINLEIPDIDTSKINAISIINTKNQVLHTIGKSKHISKPIDATKFVFNNEYYAKVIKSNNAFTILSPVPNSNKTLFIKTEPNVKYFKELPEIISWKRIFIALVIVAFGLILLYFYLIRIFKPLLILKENLNSVAQGNIHINIEEIGAPELKQLFSQSKNIISSLQQIETISKTIATGDYSKQIEQKDSKDYIAKSLNHIIENLKKAEEEEKKRKEEDKKTQWINEGIAKFSDILRQNKNLKDLSFDIISNLIKYLNANQGGLFILNDDKENPLLELYAAYAYNRQKLINKSYALKEGLVGSCAIEKQTVYLKDIPDEYINITSGLGDEVPNCILLVPLKVEEDVLGVIEIASFKELLPHEINFVEQVCEDIGGTLANVRINNQTAELLKQSEKQAEMLATKEKEMHENMEELKHTQEESIRREEEMNLVLRAFEELIYRIEIERSGKILKTNSLISNRLSYHIDELTVMSIYEIAVENDRDNLTEWISTIDNDIKEAQFAFKSRKGDTVYLKIKGILSSSEDSSDKIILSAVDITEEVKAKETISTKSGELHETTETLQSAREEIIKREFELAGLYEAIDQSLLKAELTSNGDITLTNTKFLKTVKTKFSEIANKNINNLVPKKNKKEFSEIWENVSMGMFFSEPMEMINNEGEILHLLVSFTPVRDIDGDIEKVLFLANDFTEHKNTEIKAVKLSQDLLLHKEELKRNLNKVETSRNELLQKDTQLQQAFDAIVSITKYCEISTDGRIIKAGRLFLDRLGYSNNEIEGVKIDTLISVDSGESFDKAWSKVESQSVFGIKCKLITKDDKRVEFNIDLTPIKTEGIISKVIFVIHDQADPVIINQKEKQIEQYVQTINSINTEISTLKKSLNQLQEQYSNTFGYAGLIQEQMPIIEFDINQKIISTNEHYTKMLNIPEDEIVGKYHYEFTTANKDDENYIKFWNDLKEGKQKTALQYISSGDNQFWVKENYYPVFNPEGEIIKILNIIQDITEYKKLEKKLENAIKEIERLKE